MKRKLSVRFFGVERMRNTDPLLDPVLNEIYAKSLEERKIDVEGVKFRLERLDRRNAKLIGEVTRIQEDDYPSEVTADGVRALDVDSDLGRGVVFCFDPQRHLIAVPWDAQLISMTKLEAYLAIAHPGAAFNFKAKIKRDAWLEFERNPIKSFSVSLAGFEGLAGLEGDREAAWESLGRFSRGYGNHTLTLKLSRGHKGGALSEGIKQVAAALFASPHVRSMHAKTDVKGSDDINLIDQVLSEKVEIDFPRNNPDERYRRIAAALEAAMIRNADNL